MSDTPSERKQPSRKGNGLHPPAEPATSARPTAAEVLSDMAKVRAAEAAPLI
jgi:hypothetical protein